MELLLWIAEHKRGWAAMLAQRNISDKIACTAQLKLLDQTALPVCALRLCPIEREKLKLKFELCETF